jgi:hypothetical protein
MANCPKCGLSIALVGRNHSCKPKSKIAAKSVSPAAEIEISKSKDKSRQKITGTTYRYRNADARREYMREYMRRRRASYAAASASRS